MKKNCILINSSRGGLIDTKALICALRSRAIFGAAMDVYENEGSLFFTDHSDDIIHDDALEILIGLPNAIVTGHQAFLTKEALTSIAQTTINNLESIYNQNVCDNIV